VEAKRLRNDPCYDELPPFTVISNNCWGSAAYGLLNQPYRTPFVGLFLMPDCYLKLLADWRRVVASPLKFVDRSRYASNTNGNEAQYQGYPIGLLDGEIELHFLHYKSEMDAHDKWTRRVDRMVHNDGRVFVKFCDHDAPSREQLRQFDELPLANKVCFYSDSSLHLKCGLHLPGYERDRRVPDGWQLFSICQGRFDVMRWFSGGLGKRTYTERVVRKLLRFGGLIGA
jgi:uncharacterized protein (DUF1919 family)